MPGTSQCTALLRMPPNVGLAPSAAWRTLPVHLREPPPPRQPRSPIPDQSIGKGARGVGEERDGGEGRAVVGGKGPPVALGVGGALQTAVGARPTSGGSQLLQRKSQKFTAQIFWHAIDRQHPNGYQTCWCTKIASFESPQHLPFWEPSVLVPKSHPNGCQNCWSTKTASFDSPQKLRFRSPLAIFELISQDLIFQVWGSPGWRIQGPSTQWNVNTEKTQRFYIWCVIKCHFDATSDAELFWKKKLWLWLRLGRPWLCVVDLIWGKPKVIGKALRLTPPPLAALDYLRGIESRAALFPESRARNRQNFRSEKQKNEWYHSEVESRRIDPKSPIQIATCQSLVATLQSQDSNRPTLNSESPIQCH